MRVRKGTFFSSPAAALEKKCCLYIKFKENQGALRIHFAAISVN